MIYRESPAPGVLRGLAECGWSSEHPAGARAFDVLPDACMDLVWTGAELLVAGPDTGPHPYHPLAGGSAGLRFAPGRLPALLDRPAAALRDQRVPLAELHPGLARWATGRCEQGADPSDVLLELALRLPGGLPGRSVGAVLGCVGRGRSAAGTADALGWTTRSLHRHCLDWFGYGPSVLRRILRFRRAATLLRSGMPTAEVAARTGYADQPHLSREVRALSGMAPGQLGSGA